MRAGLIAPALFAAAALGQGLIASCGGAPKVTILLDDTSGKRGDAVFAELLVYTGACPSLETLSRGNIGSPAMRQVVDPAESFSAIGELDAATYGFAVLLRGGDCGVLASGCTEANLANVTTIVVPVGEIDDVHGACGTSCVDGACQGGSSGGGAGGSGAGGGDGSCSLELVADGALPPLALPGGSVTGPGVAATREGFVLAYREGASMQPTAATLIQVTSAGSAGTPSSVPLASCLEPDDGVAVAVGDTGGLVAITRSPCAGTGAGLSLLPFDSSGVFGTPTSTADLGPSVRLARTHGLVPFEAGYEGAFVGGPTAFRARLTADGSAAPTALFAGETSTFSEVAVSPGLVAFLADRTGGAETETTLVLMPPGALHPAPGAGGGGGAGGGPGEPRVVSTHLGRAASAWGAVTAWPAPASDRAAAIVAEADGTITWAAFDADGASRGAGTLAPAVAQVFTTGDVVATGDRVIVAAARARGFHLWKLEGALHDGLAESGPGVEASSVVGTQNLGNYDGVRLALAAGGGRVLVAWITRDKPSAGDPIGGWALYACGK